LPGGGKPRLYIFDLSQTTAFVIPEFDEGGYPESRKKKNWIPDQVGDDS